MKSRCDNPRASDYPRYGGRGIRYDPTWASFDAFLSDMGKRPEGMTLDRIDNSMGYSKANCRWATHTEQQNNQRPRTVQPALPGQMPSAEFRKTYAKLREPTVVTALGRTIGQWIPAHSATYVIAQMDETTEVFGIVPPEDAKTRPPKPGDPIFRGGHSQQAERDAILRKVNRTK